MKKMFSYRLPTLLLAGMLMFSTCQKDEDKPIIVKVSPDSGQAGDVIMVSGLLLGQATRVVFGTVESAVTAAENKAVSTQVPAGLPVGKVNLTVETPGGISNLVEFTILAAIPEITAIVPAKGSRGMRVTLTGRYFSEVKEVTFGDQKITVFEASSNTQLVIKIPGNSTLGEKVVMVTTASGVSKRATFTVVPPPSLTSFSPTAGQTGKHVSIYGASLNGITAVYFQDAAAVFEVKSTTLIDAIVPAAAATGKLKVVGDGGEALSDTDFVVEGAPVVASFAPASGTLTTEVTINGGNFLPDAKVLFGNIYAKTTFVNENQLKATVPAGATSGPIVVETAAGTGKSNDNFSVIPAPSIDRFTPVRGVAGKTTITIIGTNFKDVSSVKFNGAEAGQANITVNSLTSLDVKVPTLASTGTVRVTNPSGTGVSAAIFTVVDPSSALAFSPTSGPVGTLITLTGFDFDNTSKVKFNGVAVDPGGFTWESETSLQVRVPANSTTGRITVTTENITLSSPQEFTVIQPPDIDSFMPTSGPAGTPVTISGSHFDNATVEFNGMAITSGLRVTSNTISFNVPTAATSGAIKIKTVAGDASTGIFTVVPPPQIISFSPSMGVVGSTVTLSGSSFDQASSVQFNGTETGSLNFQVNSSSMISAKVPVGATTGSITVTTPAGSYTTASSFTVAPAVTSFSPATGPIGTPVRIRGANFDNATDVSFNGVPASYTVQSTTSIEAMVPPGARTGAITVTTAAGTGSSGYVFGVTPDVTSINPTPAVVGSTVTIDGSGLGDVTKVTFSNGVAAVFFVNSDTQIIATVPQGAVSGDVVVSNSAGSDNISFTLSLTPVLNSVTPPAARAGAHIMISGYNLDKVTQVAIEGTRAVIVKSSTTSLEVVVPSGLGVGRRTIIAYTPVEFSNSLTFTINH
ncbi:IPT/TIG domain-containing protein [Chryseolinea soli]|nr:IPT/TIG domain-containing protein [Chryseolinea soli]